MRLLLDTQIVLWWLNGDRALPAPAKNLVLEPGNEAFVSKAALWEMAIKIGVGKLEANLAKIVREISANGFRYLEIEPPPHTLKLIELPTFDDHKGLFDRLMARRAWPKPCSCFPRMRS